VRDQIFFGHAGRAFNDDFALPFDDLTDFNHAVNFRNNSRIFRFRASKSSATRGRPPVISRVLAILRGVLASNVPLGDLLPVFDHDMRGGRDRIKSEDFFVFAANQKLRVQIFLVLDDDAFGHAVVDPVLHSSSHRL